MNKVLGPLFCCGGRGSRPKREHTRRRHRKKHAPGPSKVPTVRNELGGIAASIASDSEYHDAREAFSVCDGDHSPLASAEVSPRAPSSSNLVYTAEEAYQEIGSGSVGDTSETGSQSSESSQGFGSRLVSCLSIMRASSAGEADFPVGQRTPRSTSGNRAGLFKLQAGCTFQRRRLGDDPDRASMCWDECEATTYNIRSQDYMRTKQKQPSGKAIYRLVAMDMFATDTKAFHVAKSFALPPTGPPVVCRPVEGGGPDVVLPPLLIMNVQLPDYPAAFWGANDGPGQSIVYYFTLREDFDPDKCENKAALGLLQRFVTNGREADGSPTRDRLKMIARVANLEEWARLAPLNTAEYKLLLNYNDKPVLTRPQQVFHVGPNYLEVDLDVHSYAFLARKALWSYHQRIATLIWENAFVIQGNSPEELPEQLLGCGRIYRSDFRRFKHLSDVISAVQTPTAMHTPLPTPGGPRFVQDLEPGVASSTAADAAVLVNGGPSAQQGCAVILESAPTSRAARTAAPMLSAAPAVVVQQPAAGSSSKQPVAGSSNPQAAATAAVTAAAAAAARAATAPNIAVAAPSSSSMAPVKAAS